MLVNTLQMPSGPRRSGLVSAGTRVLLCCLASLHLLSSGSRGQELQRPARPVVSVPRIESAPTLEDFLPLGAPGPAAQLLAKIEGFAQVMPTEGGPVGVRTEAYMGYDTEALYVIILAFDPDPSKVRARLARRDAAGIFSDDLIELRLDTFDDHRQGYYFAINPYGVQIDALWSEGEGGFDQSFDCVWRSRGQITEDGYVVWLAIPFRSLRFPAALRQDWGFYLGRLVPHLNEVHSWPPLTKKVQSLLSQTAQLSGLEGISPGRNLKLIPYATAASLDLLDEPAESTVDGGLDAKVVLRDSYVLDLTLNPDFAQVESDLPQVTINRRFEVLFPEKRPFFLENAGFLQTPMNLVFTRRIIEPRLGLRFTGKTGPYNLGVLLTDDEAPGRQAPAGSSLEGESALFSVLRLRRDLFRQSSAGLLYTEKRLAGVSNRVGSVDFRFTLDPNWSTVLQLARSFTDADQGADPEGSAVDFELTRTGQQFNYALSYEARSPEFRADAGFIPRVDFQRLRQQVGYRFRPEGPKLIAFGPDLTVERLWSYDGDELDQEISPAFEFELLRQTTLTLRYTDLQETLQPTDFPALTAPQQFDTQSWTVQASSEFFSRLSTSVNITWGSRVNLIPPAAAPPAVADLSSVSAELSWRLTSGILFTGTYLSEQLREQHGARDTAFRVEIARARLDWQLARRLSLRFIVQQEEIYANARLTRLNSSLKLDADVLASYLLNPWTAVYVGWNGVFDERLLLDSTMPPSIARTLGDLRLSDRQFFIKVSRLFQF